MEARDLIAEVARRHNVLLSPDDPALAVATVAELVLRETGRELEARLAELLAAHRQSQGAAIPLRMGDDAEGELENLAAIIRAAAADAARARLWAFAAAGLSGGIALGIVLVLTAPVWGTVFL